MSLNWSFCKPDSWHDNMRTVILPVPESQVMSANDNGDNNTSDLSQSDSGVAPENADKNSDLAMGMGPRWGDGRAFNVIFEAQMSDNSMTSGNYVLDGYTTPVNFCKASTDALIKIGNMLGAKAKKISLLEISRKSR